MGRERTAEEVAARKAKKDAKRAAAAAAKPDVAASPGAPSGASSAIAATRALFARGVRLADQLNPRRPNYNEALKKIWKVLSKKDRRQLEEEDKTVGATAAPSGSDAGSPVAPATFDAYPFPVEPSDHCETPPEAFADVVPLLELLAERLGKDLADLAVWDPYFCAGASKRHLAAVGLPKVHNECEDFYEVVRKGLLPPHDVVITNPPYSEPKDGGPPHPARLLRFLTGSDGKVDPRPFLVCMPEYCASAAYYSEVFPDPQEAPLLLCPYRRYHFWTPEGARPGRNSKIHRKKGLGLRNSPFVALWYVNLEPVVKRRELLRLAKAGALRGIDVYGAGQNAKEPHADSTDDTVGSTREIRCRLCRRVEGLPEGRERFNSKRDASAGDEEAATEQQSFSAAPDDTGEGQATAPRTKRKRPASAAKLAEAQAQAPRKQKRRRVT